MGKIINYRKATNEELSQGFPEMIKISEDYVDDFQTESLEEAINFKKDLIDQKTQELIFKGFTFNNLRWSLSINAQINWNNLPQLPEIVFPLAIQDMNGVDYDLEFSQRMDFYYTAVAVKNSHLQSGNALKKQILQLTTIEEVISFLDPR